MEAFNRELVKLLFKPMDAQELQDPEKVSTIWVKNLNKIVNKMNNTVSSMIGMKHKDAIKLDTMPLDKKYPEETALPKDGLYRYLYRIVQEPANRVLYYLQDGPGRAFVNEELMHISEDTQVPPDWVSEWE